MTRRDAISNLIGGGALAAGGCLGWSACVSRVAIAQDRVERPAPEPGLRGVTIAQLSDVHWDPVCDPTLLRFARQLLEADPPDFLCLTGDLLSRRSRREDELIDLLAALPARRARLASPGNHDVWTDEGRPFRRIVRSAGWTLLDNDFVEPHDLPLVLAGLDSYWGGDPQPGLDRLAKLGRHPVLLLSHEPDPFVAHATAVPRLALQLSGHTHGGQICLPSPEGGRALRLPSLGKRFPRGTFVVDDLAHRPALHVNRGLGTLAPNLRLFSAPELTRITFV